MNTYRPNEFRKLIAKSTHTLQVWDRKGILKAHRSPPTNRRFYTHDQLSEILGIKEKQTRGYQLLPLMKPSLKWAVD